MSKIGIVCALYIEAKPFIKFLKLKPIKSLSSLQLFGNDVFELIVTGTSKTASACGTTYLLTKNSDISTVVNIGICGSKKENIGDIFLIKKITDFDTKRNFYPDILIRNQTDFDIKNIITVSTTLSKKDVDDSLIDMESSGFYEAASNFLNADKIQVIKIISDNLDKEKLDSKEIESLINKHIKKIIEYIIQFTENETSCFSKLEETIIINFINKYHLTLTQKRKFKNILWSLKIQTDEDINNILKKYLFDQAKSRKKDLSKMILENMEKNLIQF